MYNLYRDTKETPELCTKLRGHTYNLYRNSWRQTLAENPLALFVDDLFGLHHGKAMRLFQRSQDIRPQQVMHLHLAINLFLDPRPKTVPILFLPRRRRDAESFIGFSVELRLRLRLGFSAAKKLGKQRHSGAY